MVAQRAAPLAAEDAPTHGPLAPPERIKWMPFATRAACYVIHALVLYNNTDECTHTHVDDVPLAVTMQCRRQWQTGHGRPLVLPLPMAHLVSWGSQLP